MPRLLSAWVPGAEPTTEPPGLGGKKKLVPKKLLRVQSIGGKRQGSDSETDPAGAPGPGGGGVRVSEHHHYPVIPQLLATLMKSFSEHMEVGT